VRRIAEAKQLQTVKHFPGKSREFQSDSWHSRFRRSERDLVWRTVNLTLTDLENDDHQGMLLELIGDDCRAIEQIESALDLELAIERALKKLSPDDRDDALILIQLRLQGLTRKYVTGQAWPTGTSSVLRRGSRNAVCGRWQGIRAERIKAAR